MIRLADIPAWVGDAVCATVDAELFDQGSNATREAKAVCGAGTDNPCPVLDLCREYAIQDPTLEGVWGGTVFNERQKIRVQLGIRRGSECGTLGGYKKHIAAKTAPCDECKGANAKYQRDRRERKAGRAS